MARRKGYSVEVYSSTKTPTQPFGHSVEIRDIPTLDEAMNAAAIAMRNMTVEGTLKRGDEVMIYEEPSHDQIYGAIVRDGEWRSYETRRRTR